MKYLMALVILLSINFIANTASAAENNGHGLVYHRSDCGENNVRMYGNGGRWDGSACGAWLFTKFHTQVVHSTDYNFNVDQLACIYNQFSFQLFYTTYTISDDELRGCGLDVLINSPGFQELRKKKVRGNELRDEGAD